VLVVEDNRETLFIYEKFLKGTGFQAVPARTLRAARRALEEFRPVAVVLDILLEGENTWELIAELKRQPKTRDLPLWVVTMVDNQHKAVALGADDFCSKPVDRAWLLDRLQTAAAPEARAKVLLIDDDEVSRYLFKGLLADTRFAVVEAADGEEGLRLARQEQPRAIFLDLDLPGLSGPEILQALRAEPATRDIPVVIHTAKVLDEAERQRLAREAAAILPKGAPSREIAVARLREALTRAGLCARPTGEGHV
jgi:CheY-like chemotaxis protein